MSPELDLSAFRQTLGRFPCGVTVVTTRIGAEDHAITASAFSSVSLDPPLVLVCVDRLNRFHDAVLASSEWAVSVLAEAAQDAATWFATRGRPLAGQLDKVDHRRGVLTGAGLVGEALAWLECRTWQVYDGGDHSILVGEVLDAQINAECDNPLLYYRSHYGALLHSAASEKSTLVLRESIVEDAVAYPGLPSTSEEAPSA